jgi:thiamine pyrophosphate-dependent acetolactate synthase large subunit-like protein
LTPNSASARHAQNPGKPDVQHEADLRRALRREAFGGKGFFVEDPKDIKGALAEAMDHRGPALVNI